ncbi:hypothetical protein GWK47_030404 [Chionoecetes opilio]|uniref:Uncharacterized protein n=1 Tax=Chionoecetes opilio TaxID=41210 RepID=A0A8J4Z1K5_CHIOP|nr:hypothetical protein GWK47_030404 [Chionoecetes opilio]
MKIVFMSVGRVDRNPARLRRGEAVNVVAKLGWDFKINAIHVKTDSVCVRLQECRPLKNCEGFVKRNWTADRNGSYLAKRSRWYKCIQPQPWKRCCCNSWNKCSRCTM